MLLFYRVGGTPILNAGFGQSSGPIWLTEASCLGDEQKLVECRIDANTNYCSHSDDAGLRCLPIGQLTSYNNSFNSTASLCTVYALVYLVILLNISTQLL